MKGVCDLSFQKKGGVVGCHRVVGRLQRQGCWTLLGGSPPVLREASYLSSPIREQQAAGLKCTSWRDMDEITEKGDFLTFEHQPPYWTSGDGMFPSLYSML